RKLVDLRSGSFQTQVDYFGSASNDKIASAQLTPRGWVFGGIVYNQQGRREVFGRMKTAALGASSSMPEIDYRTLLGATNAVQWNRVGDGFDIAEESSFHFGVVR